MSRAPIPGPAIRHASVSSGFGHAAGIRGRCTAVVTGEAADRSPVTGPEAHHRDGARSAMEGPDDPRPPDEGGEPHDQQGTTR